MVSASASGKVILLGEHAVVYGRPAIAVPLSALRATATLTPHPGPFHIQAPAVGVDGTLADLPASDPLVRTVLLAAESLQLPLPSAVLRIESQIPVASGLGSGAAVSTAIVRALAAFGNASLTPAQVSALVYEVERLHHGTPSGIDNTVIAYERPVYFRKGKPPEPLPVRVPLYLVVADSGIASPTRQVVEAVRKKWEAQPVRYDFLFDQIGELVEEARAAIGEGDRFTLGVLMDQNHELLQKMGVSTRRLDELVEAARLGGALGAKLSGAGRGGNVIALVEEEIADEVEEILKEAGARRVILTVIGSSAETAVGAPHAPGHGG